MRDDERQALRETEHHLRMTDPAFAARMTAPAPRPFMLDQAMTAVLVPGWATERFDDAAPVGLVFGAASAGAVVGSLLVPVYGHRLPRWRTYALAFLLGAVPKIFVLVLPVGLPVVAVVALACEVLIGAIDPLLSAAEFERIPAGLRARVLGAVGGLAWAGIPVGGLLGGVLASTLGATGAILVVGTAYLLAGSRDGPVVVARAGTVRDSLAVYGYLSQRLSASLLGRHQNPRHGSALRRARPQGWNPAVGR